MPNPNRTVARERSRKWHVCDEVLNRDRRGAQALFNDWVLQYPDQRVMLTTIKVGKKGAGERAFVIRRYTK